jgi:hypothetical protein
MPAEFGFETFGNPDVRSEVLRVRSLLCGVMLALEMALVTQHTQRSCGHLDPPTFCRLEQEPLGIQRVASWCSAAGR